MFCCLGSTKSQNDKKPLESKNLTINLKNKKPQDFMKDEIPLFLNDNISFSLAKNLKWKSNNLKNDPPSQSAPQRIPQKSEQNDKLIKEAMEKKKNAQLKLIEQTRIQEAVYLQTIQSELKCKAMEYLTARQMQSIYSYEQKSKKLL